MKNKIGNIHIVTLAVALSGLFSATGCINIKMVNVGQKTAYERQLTGTYEELDANLAISASVRGGTENPGSDNHTAYQNAVAARRRQHFNDDDINHLKEMGCLGETFRGFLVAHECSESQENTKLQELIKRLMREENQDRKAIIELAIQLDSTLTPASSTEMRKVFYHLFRANAKSGYWFEESAGQWIKIN